MVRPNDAVAFVVPVYNKARWLPRVLDQIAAQRGSFAREYIFVDDGSTDGSLSALKRHTAGWCNVTIIEQANHGPAHATNRGIKRATAPFIKLCDADDLLADDATAVLLDALRRDERPVLAYGGGEDFDDEADIVLNAPLAGAPTAVIARPLRPALRHNLFRPAQCLVRTAVARDCGGCDEGIPFGQDYTLALRLAGQGPFLRVGATVAFFPRDVPGRLSADTSRELRDSTTALARFVADRPRLPWRHKQFACRRAASRCRRFATRGGARTDEVRRGTALYLRSRLPILRDHSAFIERCAEVIATSAGPHKTEVRPRLSALVVARNEQEQLAACLETLRFADEIVVVLDRCTDGSRAIAERYSRTIVEGAWPLEGPRRHAGIDACTGDWILEVDADERVPEALAREIRDTIRDAAPGYFMVPFENFVGERLVRHGWGGVWGVTKTARLFTPGAKQWCDQRIHPRVALRGPERRLKAAMHHYVDRDLADMVERLQRYTDAHAADLRESGARLPPLVWTLRRSLSRFLKCYVSRRGYLEGRWGFAIALMAALYPLLSHLKAELDGRVAEERVPPAGQGPT
ncbi:MAG: glycosyltransferase [Rhodospirillales bacterium]|nr:glycosyltransferase [Rhodospirillales bacterium]